MDKKAIVFFTIISLAMLGNSDDKTTRRSFLGKIKDAYVQGRYSAEEKRILERKTQEKMRRRYWFERNVNKLTDGLAKRLKSRPSKFWFYMGGTAAVILWLCHKNSVGCERNEKD